MSDPTTINSPLGIQQHYERMLNAVNHEADIMLGRMHEMHAEIERLTAALATAEAERDAAVNGLRAADRVLARPEYYDQLQAEAHHEVLKALRIADHGQPAAAPAVDAAPVGEREPSYNAFKHQYDDEVPDRGHTAYTLESAADWCLQAIEQTDMRDNYNIEHEQAIQALTYGLQDVIGYLKSKGETQS